MSSLSGVAAPQPVKLSLPLKYQQNLFQELRSEDVLVVLARGLGLLRLVSNLLHSYDAAGQNLILLVGASDMENIWLGEALAEHAAVSASPLARGLVIVNTDLTSVGSREKMYVAGGLFSITSRILVVDLLTGLLDAATVTGVLVLHADRVVATSLEAFILRVYRQKNKTGFLKAFSDNPDPFATGFSPLATMMRNMFLRRASLWPRFQVTVAQSLEGRKAAEVIELDVPMTDAMRDVQNAILECVEVSIQDLRRANPGLLDVDDFNLDTALLKNFDVQVRRQLDPHWHRLSWRTRQTVGDLAVLRGLLTSVLALDAVTFLQHLDTILAAHAPPPGSTRQTQSPWLFLDAAHTIFDTARRRVYQATRKAAAREDGTGDIDVLQPVLEELPKWAVLADVLDEIDRALYLEPPLRGDGSNETVLVMCNSTDTCRQLRDYLQTMHLKPGRGSTEQQQQQQQQKERGRTKGAAQKAQEIEGADGGTDRVEIAAEGGDHDHCKPSAAFAMRRKLRNYLKWKRHFAHINTALFTENQRALNTAVDARLARTNSLLGRRGRGGTPANKRRRVRGGGSGTATVVGRLDNGSIAQYFEKPEEVRALMDEVRPTTDDDNGSGSGGGSGGDSLDNMEDYFQLYDMSDLVVIHAYDGDRDEHVLEEVKPRYVIMYEPDAAFIRRVEVYRSSHSGRAVRVYFMYYGGSVEEQRYLAAVRREKDAFTKVIKERASMSVVITTDERAGGDDHEDPQEAFLRTVNTRIAGGGRLVATAQPPRVVVDVREFRSSLPSLLHGRSMVIVPCMLTVGDYVLTPDMVVERKSVADLVSSFRDGRLYGQCEAMFAHYRDALLLIEFDQDRSFTLEPFADLSGSAASRDPTAAPDLQSRIVLLTLAFPRLRVLWSSSPYQTAEMFEGIKRHEPEPDPIAAVRAGAGGAGDDDNKMENQAWNPEPRDMLAAVPGVTAVNMGGLMRAARSVREVANMGIDELAPVVGKEDARKMYEFFTRNVMEED